LVLQLLAVAVMVGLLAGTVYLAVEVDNAAVLMAAGAVFLIAAFVLVSWAALVLGLGISPRQLIALIKALFGALEKASEESGEGA
jgi:hypothetical protein